MLQQTQTDRVVPKYNTFSKRFPTVRSLASASLRDVLSLWQGLGYNRRAKHLHEAAKKIVVDFGGTVPNTESELRTIPGVGPYIAGAVSAFAFNKPVVFIETNIRTALTHHLFPPEEKSNKKIADSELLPILGVLVEGEEPREWYSALMDYGAYLKRSGVRINSRSHSYTKQSKFEGSDRQIRGRILKLLKEKSVSKKVLLRQASEDSERAKVQLAKLLEEGLISKKGTLFELG